MRDDRALPVGVGYRGEAPIADKRFGALSDPKGAVLAATVFVHFHKNKFKFLYKHKTA